MNETSVFIVKSPSWFLVRSRLHFNPGGLGLGVSVRNVTSSKCYQMYDNGFRHYENGKMVRYHEVVLLCEVDMAQGTPEIDELPLYLRLLEFMTALVSYVITH